MPADEFIDRDSPSRCVHCGTPGPLKLRAYPHDGRAPIALCAACAREPAHLRALIRALGPRAGQPVRAATVSTT